MTMTIMMMMVIIVVLIKDNIEHCQDRVIIDLFDVEYERKTKSKQIKFTLFLFFLLKIRLFHK